MQTSQRNLFFELGIPESMLEFVIATVVLEWKKI